MREALLAGRYQLRRILAAGGSARVVLAEDTKLARPVVVKLPLAAAAVPAARARFEREGRITGAIAHPNVCALLDLGEAATGEPFLVYEALTGETLAARIERMGAMPADQAVRIGEQLLLALQAVHEAGVVHRDVKPENIFLVDLLPGTPLVKLLDFGTALVPGDAELDGATLTSTGLVVGTVEYMSPEQVRGVRDFDARSDLYSAGVVFFEMLTGRRPFVGHTAVIDLLQAIGYEKAPPLAELAPRTPRAVARAVDVALAVDRERRHRDAAAFLVALRSPHAPPLTAATRALRAVTTTPSSTGVDEWDMATKETGPPSVAEVPEEPAPDSSTTVLAPLGPRNPRGR